MSNRNSRGKKFGNRRIHPRETRQRSQPGCVGWTRRPRKPNEFLPREKIFDHRSSSRDCSLGHLLQQHFCFRHGESREALRRLPRGHDAGHKFDGAGIYDRSLSMGSIIRALRAQDSPLFGLLHLCSLSDPGCGGSECPDHYGLSLHSGCLWLFTSLHRGGGYGGLLGPSGQRPGNFSFRGSYIFRSYTRTDCVSAMLGRLYICLCTR